LQGSTAIVVGSEGGFSQEEFDLSKEYGYKTVYLGKRILRAETACIGLCAIIMNSLQELK
jgi:16S rRNA (uracil1498-N3)-methyltransferase